MRGSSTVTGCLHSQILRLVENVIPDIPVRCLPESKLTAVEPHPLLNPNTSFAGQSKNHIDGKSIIMLPGSSRGILPAESQVVEGLRTLKALMSWCFSQT